MARSLAFSGTFTKLDYRRAMATNSTIMRDPRSRVSEFASSLTRQPLLVALAVTTVIVCVRLAGSVDADVSWQLWAAHQMNGGARLYRDIVEINPPLWFWMGMPVDALAKLIHVRSDQALIAIIGAIAALSLAATDRLLPAMPATKRTFLLGFAALVLVALPWLQFGQREHIATIGALPYAALVAARRTGRNVPLGLACAVGAGAALGFALKHYFLLVPILLELWLLVSQGRKWRPVRPEALAMIGVGIGYAAAMAMWGTDYFSRALPIIFISYGLTGAERTIDLFQPSVLTALASLVLLIAHRRSLRSDPSGLASAMIVAAIGFGAAYFIQAKGWSYHALPLAAFAVIAVAVSLTAESKPRFIVLVAPALLLLPFWISAQQAIRGANPHPDVRHALAGLHAGDSVAFMGTDPSVGWPDTLDEGFRYPSRYSSFWMMRAVVRNAAADDPNPKVTQFGARVVEETVEDFECMPPRRIIVARPPASAAKGEFDILAFFLRDPRFVQLLARYRPVSRTSVEAFELVSPLPSRSDCIRRVTG
jgi:hypothetical protein